MDGFNISHSGNGWLVINQDGAGTSDVCDKVLVRDLFSAKLLSEIGMTYYAGCKDDALKVLCDALYEETTYKDDTWVYVISSVFGEFMLCLNKKVRWLPMRPGDTLDGRYLHVSEDGDIYMYADYNDKDVWFSLRDSDSTVTLRREASESDEDTMLKYISKYGVPGEDYVVYREDGDEAYFVYVPERKDWIFVEGRYSVLRDEFDECEEQIEEEFGKHDAKAICRFINNL